jgi:DNA-directed RNA polymerase subunit M/transcription elongation factor TFIIS
MQFCARCDNMYYICIDPGMDPESDASSSGSASGMGSTLVNYCRNCGHKEPVQKELCVSKLQIKHSAQNYGNIINQYTKFDPTLPRISHVKCPNSLCSSNPQPSEKSEDTIRAREVIYIRYDEENMKYVYLCAICDTLWSTVQASAPI